MGITVVGLPIADSATATVHSGDPACRSSQLAVWRAEPGDPALGSVYYELQFSNVSDRACSLQGFPRVVAAGDSDNQVGAAAAREPGSTPDRVVLRPGATAHA